MGIRLNIVAKGEVVEGKGKFSDTDLPEAVQNQQAQGHYHNASQDNRETPKDYAPAVIFEHFFSSARLNLWGIHSVGGADCLLWRPYSNKVNP